MKFIFGFCLMIFTMNGLAYKACEGVVDSSCNKTKVTRIQDQLEGSFKGNTTYIYFELLRQKTLDKYEEYKKQLSELTKCYEAYVEKKASETCIKKLTENYNQVIEQNYISRLSLALWRPKRNKDDFSSEKDPMLDVALDHKFNSDIEHLSFVSDRELEPLSKNEKKDALKFFDQNKKEYFDAIEELKNPTNPETQEQKEKEYFRLPKVSKKPISYLDFLISQNQNKKELVSSKHAAEKPTSLLETLKVEAENRVVMRRSVNVPKKPKTFVEILEFQDHIKELRKKNMEYYKSLYLQTVVANPVIKHITRAIPSVAEINFALIKTFLDVDNNMTKIRNMPFEDLRSLLHFEGLVEDVLLENPFFCVTAEDQLANIEFDDKVNEILLSFGGLLLCPIGGVTCGGALFAGSVVNFMNSKEKLDLSLELGSAPELISSQEIERQASKAGLNAGLMALSGPYSVVARVGGKALGFNYENLKGYLKAIKQEGFKRSFIKKISDKKVFKLGFKKVKATEDLITTFLQAPILVISKVVTQSTYALKPFEYSAHLLEKRLLKEGFELAGPVGKLASFSDDILLFSVYLEGIDRYKTHIEKSGDFKKIAELNFDSLDVDPRFNKVREIKTICLATETCKDDVESIVKYNQNLVAKGFLYFKNLESKHKGSSEFIEKIENDPKMIEFGLDLFPNFYNLYPDGTNVELSEPKRKAQRAVFYLDIMRLQVSDALKFGAIEDYLDGKPASGAFKTFVDNSNVSKIINSEKDPVRRKKLVGERLNHWIQINQQKIFDESAD